MSIVRTGDCSPLQRKLILLVASLGVIIAGLLLRVKGYQFGLPFFFVKYGGSILWGAMVYGLTAMVLVAFRRSLVASLAVAIAVELSRLIHTPELDAFRLTMAGALLLGRIFSPWNIVAYCLGIVIASVLDRLAFSPKK